jgi:hypothetical protein
MVSALGAQQAVLSGRVYDAGSGHGIASLSVRLEPPKGAGDRQIVNFTDAEGRFQIPSLRAGRYLPTVFQGLNLLHREVVDTKGATTKDIRLQRG